MKSYLFILIAFAIMAAGIVAPAAAIPYTVSGNSVFVNDSNVYLMQTPHTLTDSGYAYITLQSKQFTGNANVVFGFDSDNAKPKSIDLYNPHNVEFTASYTCDAPYFGNATPANKTFYCWYNDTLDDGMPHTNKTILVFSHAYDSINQATKTAYWKENRTEEWTSILSMFNSVNYGFDGKNKWYYAQNVPITAGQTYKVRLWVDIKFNTKGKYDFAIYPSSYGTNIGQAISNNHFYYLDPWWNTTYTKKIRIDFTNNNVSLPYYAYEMVFKGTQLNPNNMNQNGTDIRVVNATEDGTVDFFIDYWNQTADKNTSIWINLTNNTGTVYVYYGNPAATTSTSNSSKVFDLASDDGEDGVGKWTLPAGHVIGECASGGGFTGLGTKCLQLNITGSSYSPSRIPFTAVSSGYVTVEYYANFSVTTTGDIIVCAATDTTNCYNGFQNDWMDNSGSSPKNRYVHYAAGVTETLIAVVNVTGGTWYKVKNVYNLTGATKYGTFYLNESGNLATMRTVPNLVNSGARSNANIGFVGFAAGSGSHKVQFDNYKVYKSLPNVTGYPVMTVGSETENLQITIQSPLNVTNSTLTTILNYTVATSATIDKCWYKLNAAANVTLASCANTTFTAAQGSNTLIVGVNTTGGAFSSATVSFTADSEFPSVSIQLPANTTYYTATRALDYTASDNLGMDSCIRELNGANATLAGCGNTTFTAVAGSNTLKVYVNDSAGNKNVSEVKFTFAPPIVRATIQSPTNTTLTTGNITFAYTIFAENVTLDKCWYKLDAASNVTLPSCGNTSFSAAVGNHSITIGLNSTGGIFNSTTVYFSANYAALLNITAYTEAASPVAIVTFNATISDGAGIYLLKTTNTGAILVSDLSELPAGVYTVSVVSENYTSRDYTVTTTETDTTNLTAYLLPTTSAATVQFVAKDTYNTEIDGARMLVMRYIGGSWIVIGEADSGTNGVATMLLSPLVTYVVNGSHSGYYNVTKTFTTTDSPIPITFGTEYLPHYYLWLQDSMQASCFIINGTTRNMTCYVNDTESIMTSARLIVRRMVNYSTSVLVCDVSDGSPSSGIYEAFCNLGTTNGTYIYQLTGVTNQGTYLLITGSIVLGTTPNPYGVMGLFIALFIFIVMTFMGLYHPPVAIIFGILALAFSYALGFIVLSTSGWAGLISIMLVGVVIMYKIRN